MNKERKRIKLLFEIKVSRKNSTNTLKLAKARKKLSGELLLSFAIKKKGFVTSF